MVSRRSSSTSCNQGLGRRGRRQEGIREGEKNGWKVDRFLVRFPASLEIELLKLAKWEQFCFPAELFSPKARHSVHRRTWSLIVLSCRPLSLPSLPLFCSILAVATGSPLLLKLGYWSWLFENCSQCPLLLLNAHTHTDLPTSWSSVICLLVYQYTKITWIINSCLYKVLELKYSFTEKWDFTEKIGYFWDTLVQPGWLCITVTVLWDLQTDEQANCFVFYFVFDSRQRSLNVFQLQFCWQTCVNSIIEIRFCIKIALNQ